MALFGKKNNDKNDKNEKEGASIPESTPDVRAEEGMPEAVAQEAARPRFESPAGFDFNRYFLAERRIVLENVSYETQKPAAAAQLKLGVKDTILAHVLGQSGVKITYNRSLRFEPEGPFTLSVSFAVMLVFNPGTRGEVDWSKIDVAEEFKKNCPQLVQTMMAKAALLVAEITAANGGAPIIPLR
ncbi:MAG: hypothetical protein E7672_00590 [Ruminococcaceae bacterium]|nr:hypothetical protein [Oscillospiraceae bacterium]